MQTFRLRRLHLLGPDACIIWARMPSSTLHKSAQQRAPDAYIFMCKSTTQDIRAQKMPASTSSGTRPRRCPRRHLIHAWKDTRVHPLGVHTEMHVPYAHPRRYARRPFPARAKDGRASMDACKDARVAPFACAAKMRASERLWCF